jgi:hypothetical protein
MVVCSCGLPDCCCQPAVTWGFIYADLRGELSTHLAQQALFTQSSLLHELLLQAFPFKSTVREVTLHPLSQAGVFIYSSCGKWVFPASCGVFLPPPLLQAFPLLVAGHVPPLLPSLARLIYLQFCEGLPSPTLRHSRLLTLFATYLYCSYCLLLSFSFFPWVGVGLSRGLCWSGPGLSVRVPCTA